MKLSFPNSRAVNLPAVLRQAGYHPIIDKKTQQQSWVRNLGRGHYPRFHLYFKKQADKTVLKIHLDQKQQTIKIKGLKRHAGEYDTNVIKEEVSRLKRWLQHAKVL